MFRNWNDTIFDEADLSKIKNMALQELKEKRTEAQLKVLGSEALDCPQFLKHVSQHSENCSRACFPHPALLSLSSSDLDPVRDVS